MFLSKTGEWFHDDVKITHKRTIESLNKNLRRDGEDYYVNIGYERCKVTIEDAPFLVFGVREERGELVLEISDGTEEKFNPSCLIVGEDNVPYTRIKPTKDRARFTRPAYYQLARHLVEGPDGSIAINICGKTYTLDIELK